MTYSPLRQILRDFGLPIAAFIWFLAGIALGVAAAGGRI